MSVSLATCDTDIAGLSLPKARMTLSPLARVPTNSRFDSSIGCTIPIAPSKLPRVRYANICLHAEQYFVSPIDFRLGYRKNVSNTNSTLAMRTIERRSGVKRRMRLMGKYQTDFGSIH